MILTSYLTDTLSDFPLPLITYNGKYNNNYREQYIKNGCQNKA